MTRRTCKSGPGWFASRAKPRPSRGSSSAGIAGSASLSPRKLRPPPEPRSYTPKHLADKILQSKSALEGERKQVTDG